MEEKNNYFSIHHFNWSSS